jgi:hypothetical protein
MSLVEDSRYTVAAWCLRERRLTDRERDPDDPGML